MARSIDILTSDEKHLVVFAKGVTLDKSLPKYIRIKEKRSRHRKHNSIHLKRVTLILGHRLLRR